MPAVAADSPSELARALTETFGAYVLDAIDVASEGSVLISEDLYYRQAATDALRLDIKSVWLQPVVAYASEAGLINDIRYAAIVEKLARRRHSHVWLTPEVLFDVWQADQSADLGNFQALTDFIGTENADIRSHLSVVAKFLERIWEEPCPTNMRLQQATGILLRKLLRFRSTDWAGVLAFVAENSDPFLSEYIDQWLVGHFFDRNRFAAARKALAAVRARLHMLRMVKK